MEGDDTNWVAPNSAPVAAGDAVRDGMVIYDFASAEGLTLDLVSQDDDAARLEEPVFTYELVATQYYMWVVDEWVEMAGAPDVTVTDGVVTWNGPQPINTTRVIFTVAITDDSFTDPDIYEGSFAVEFPGDPIELTEFSQDGVALTHLPDNSVVAEWIAPGDVPEGMIGYTDGLQLAIEYGPAEEAAQLTAPVTVTYLQTAQYGWDTENEEWTVIADPTVDVATDGTVTDFGSASDSRVIVEMSIADDGGYNESFYFAIDVPATLVDLETMNPGVTLDGTALATPATGYWADLYAAASTWTAATYDATATLAGTIDEESAAGVAAENPVYEYYAIGLVDADGTVADSEIPVPVVDPATGVINRNNTVIGKSNTGYYLIVRVAVEADNDVDTATATVREFAILLDGSNPPLPNNVTADDMEDALDGYKLRSAADIDATLAEENGEQNVGQLWNYPDGASGQQVYNATNVVPFPTGGVLTIEQELEEYYQGADLEVTYEIVGQYGWRQQGAEAEMNYYLDDATGNLAELEVDPDTGVVTITQPDGITTNNQNNFGDRLVLKVTVKVADGDTSGMAITGGSLVTYICVALL